MGACQACNELPTDKNNIRRAPQGALKLSSELNTANLTVISQPENLEAGKSALAEAAVTHALADESNGPISTISKEDASIIEFNLRFPVLTEAIENIDSLTNFEEVRIRLKFADDLTLSQGTRSFFKENMASVIQKVDSELTNTLGSYWTTLKAQSQQMHAIHTILVLWRAV